MAWRMGTSMVGETKEEDRGGRRRGRREIDRGLFYNADMRGESIEEEDGWRARGEDVKRAPCGSRSEESESGWERKEREEEKPKGKKKPRSTSLVE